MSLSTSHYSVKMAGVGTTYDRNMINSTIELNFYRIYAQDSANKTCVATSSFLSIIGTLTIISTYVVWEDVRTTSRSILVCLSIVDFAVAVGYFVGVLTKPMVHAGSIVAHDPVCLAQSFTTSSGSIMSFMWSTSLAIYLYLTLAKNRQVLAKKLLPLFHLLSWCIGPTINVVALSHKMLGNSDDAITAGWCWIVYQKNPTPTQKNKEILWMFIDGKLVEIAAYFIIFVLYLLMKVKLRREVSCWPSHPTYPTINIHTGGQIDLFAVVV